MKGGRKIHIRSGSGSEISLCQAQSSYGLKFQGDHWVRGKASCKNCRALQRAQAVDNLSPDPRGGEAWAESLVASGGELA
jgi:hypothetical protein